MKTLRCPTCLGVLLDGGESRCPVCRSKLKTRRKAVVLREDARITSQPLLPVERDRKARVEAELAAAEQRRYTPATLARLETPHAPRVVGPDPPRAPSPPPEQLAARAVEVEALTVPEATPVVEPARAPGRATPVGEAEHSVFDLLSDYRVDGTPERMLPATPVPAAAPEPAVRRDVAVEDPRRPAEHATGRTRSRLLRRRPITPQQRMDVAFADLRIEVKADALRRALDPNVAGAEDATGAPEAAATEADPAVDFRLHFASHAHARQTWIEQIEARAPFATESVPVEQTAVEQPAPVVEEAEPAVDEVASEPDRNGSARRAPAPEARVEHLEVPDELVATAPPVEEIAPEPVAEIAVEETAESEPEVDELAARVDESVDELLALLPEAAEEAAEPIVDEVAVEDPAEAPSPVEVEAETPSPQPEREPEEPIARVDAAVKALMALLPGAIEVPEEASVETPPEAPEPPADEAVARVDASVDALMAMITPREDEETVEEPPSAVTEPVGSEPVETPRVEDIAQPEPLGMPSIAAGFEPRRRRRSRAGQRRAELAAAIDAAARGLAESGLQDAVVASAGPESDTIAVEEPVAEVAVEEPVADVAPPEKRRRRLRSRMPPTEGAEPEPIDTPFVVEPAAHEAEPVVAEPETPAAETDVVAPTLDLTDAGAAEPEPPKRRRRRLIARRAYDDEVGTEPPAHRAEADAVEPAPAIDLTVAEPEPLTDLPMAEAAEPAEPAAAETAASTVVDSDLDIDGASEPESAAVERQRAARGRRARRRPKAPGPDAPEVLDPDVVAPEVIVPEVIVPEVIVPEVIVPEVIVPEVIVPDVIVPEIVSEPAHDVVNGNGAGVEIVAEDLPVATPVEVVDAPKPAAPPSFDLPAQTRALRVKTVRVNGKKRWVVDVLVRRPDENPKRR